MTTPSGSCSCCCWAINLAPKFNKWVKADTTTLDEVSRRLEEDAKGNEDKASFVNLIFLLGLALVISAFGQDIGAALNGAMPFLDKATWTVLLITLSGLIGAVTPWAAWQAAPSCPTCCCTLWWHCLPPAQASWS